MLVFISWSGGKDSCLALYRALKMGFKVKYLLNMLDEDGFRSKGHGLPKEALDVQAKALGIPIVYGKASWKNYEEEFKRVVGKLRSEGVEGGVFGDISISEHREWVEKVCSEVGVKFFEPLWSESYEKLMNEFMNSGFKAVIISVKANLIDEGWVGKPFNQEFLTHLKERGIDLFGERGEYHTLVTHGPIFKHRLKIIKAKKKLKDESWILEISKLSLT